MNESQLPNINTRPIKIPLQPRLQEPINTLSNTIRPPPFQRGTRIRIVKPNGQPRLPEIAIPLPRPALHRRHRTAHNPSRFINRKPPVRPHSLRQRNLLDPRHHIRNLAQHVTLRPVIHVPEEGIERHALFELHQTPPVAAGAFRSNLHPCLRVLGRTIRPPVIQRRHEPRNLGLIRTQTLAREVNRRDLVLDAGVLDDAFCFWVRDAHYHSRSPLPRRRLGVGAAAVMGDGGWCQGRGEGDFVNVVVVGEGGCFVVVYGGDLYGLERVLDRCG